MRITSITPVKDEAPFLLEWVAYHHLIGVNDIIIFSNDSSDGTTAMLERLDELGLVRHLPNPSMMLDRTKHHLQVIKYVNTWERLRRSDWVVSLDVDEYICVNAGRGTLEDLFNAVDDANVISMSQHNFGSSGIETFEDRLTTEQFTWSWDKESAYNVRTNRRGTKTLTHRSAEPRAWHNHSPVFRPRKTAKVRMVNGSGKPVEADLTRDVKSLSAPDYGFDLVQLNHYAIRSMEAFLLKKARGNANHETRSADLGYWRKYDHNDLQDGCIDRMIPAVAEAVAALKEDRELGTLHTRAVRRARARIAEMKSDPEYAALLDAVRAEHLKRRPGR